MKCLTVACTDSLQIQILEIDELSSNESCLVVRLMKHQSAHSRDYFILPITYFNIYNKSLSCQVAGLIATRWNGKQFPDLPGEYLNT